MIAELQLVPYLNLAEDEREAIHQWLNDHHVDHTRVPIADTWSLDESTNEMRIPAFHLRNGKPHLDDRGDVARVVLRRVIRRPLPWRTAQ